MGISGSFVNTVMKFKFPLRALIVCQISRTTLLNRVTGSLTFFQSRHL